MQQAIHLKEAISQEMLIIWSFKL